MGEFFNGWRRKVGCVTLLLAFVFAGVWLRAFRVEDEFTIPHANAMRNVYFSIARSGFSWTAQKSDSEIGSGYRWISRPVAAQDVPTEAGDPYVLPDGSIIMWRLKGIMGVEFRDSFLVAGDQASIIRESLWKFPHWLFVCPLILISAFLLLKIETNSFFQWNGCWSGCQFAGSVSLLFLAATLSFFDTVTALVCLAGIVVLNALSFSLWRSRQTVSTERDLQRLGITFMVIFGVIIAVMSCRGVVLST